MGALRNKLDLKQQHLTVISMPPELEAPFKAELSWTKYDEMPDLEPEAVLAFARDLKELAALIPQVLDKAGEQTILWFAYPKKRSERYDSDISRARGWERLEDQGYEPLRQISLDEDWSALRFGKR